MERKLKGIHIGNRLQRRNYLSIVDHVGGRLVERYDMILASTKDNKVLRLLDMAWHVIKYGPKSDFLIVDVFSAQNFYYALVVSQLCRLIGLPYVTNLQGGNLPWRLKNHKKLCKLIFNNATINVAPSHYLLTEFTNAGFKVELIPNPVNIEKYQFKQRREITPKVLYVRAFKEIYNPPMAVEMLNLLLKKHPDAELTMFGPHLDDTYNRAKALVDKYNLHDKVKMPGSVSQEEWGKASEDFNVFINTTNFDNTPFSVIEGMALGLPIISTNVGGIPYLIQDGENGLLTEKQNPQMMADRISELVENPDLVEKLSKNGRAKVEELDWEKKVKHMWYEVTQRAVDIVAKK